VTDQEAISTLNAFKADLSRLGHGIEMALQDGKIEGLETVALIAQGSQLGLNWYYQFVSLKKNLGVFLEALDRAKFTLD
jgi:hypothetical protein